jgi:hypothetical protein
LRFHFDGFSHHLGVGERLHLRFEGVDLDDQGRDALDVALVLGADETSDKGVYDAIKFHGVCGVSSSPMWQHFILTCRARLTQSALGVWVARGASIKASEAGLIEAIPRQHLVSARIFSGFSNQGFGVAHRYASCDLKTTSPTT